VERGILTKDELKPGWSRVRFGDVVRQVKNKADPKASGLERYVAGEHMDTDDLRIRRWGIIGDDYLGPAFHMRFKPGQVLYGSRRTYLRKVAVADFEGVCANTTLVLEPKDPTVLLPELLPFIMQTEAFHEHSIKQSRGSVNPYVNYSDLEWYEFALPPLEEQRDIANLLHSSYQVVETLKTLNERAEKQYLSVVLHLFQFGLQRRDFDDGENQKYPAHWHVMRVDECFQLQLGKMSSETSRKGDFPQPYLKNNNILWGDFDFSNLSEMSFDLYEQDKYALKKGDLLVCEGGEIGRAAVWMDEYPGLLYQKALHRLRSISEENSPEFFMHYLRYCSLKGILKSIATGTTILHLPAERLAALRLPFPPKDEQLKLVNILQSATLAIIKTKQRYIEATSHHGKLLGYWLQTYHSN
jgi:type I restriction enzyme S subunit